MAHLTVELDADYSVAHLTVELDADCSPAHLTVELDADYIVAHLTVELDADYSVAHLTVELDADCSVACSSDWLDGELPRRIIQPVEYRIQSRAETSTSMVKTKYDPLGTAHFLPEAEDRVGPRIRVLHLHVQVGQRRSKRNILRDGHPERTDIFNILILVN